MERRAPKRLHQASSGPIRESVRSDINEDLREPKLYYGNLQIIQSKIKLKSRGGTSR